MPATIEIDLELSQRSRILLDSLSKLLPARLVAPEPESVQTTAQAPYSPLKLQIGERSDAAGGIYAGISRGEDGQPDGHLFLLDDKPASKLDWADAKTWAESLGNGARLPTRFESALLYANLQDQLDQDNWHWTGTQYSDSNAWNQRFGDGNQHDFGKSYEARCRAVRRLIL
ncbi:MAG TPA: SUMF1/EgtB/PvdO family nonheme iron enzyme [Polaromonas sp.]|uniref:SUMF1/EgtB/PvdO family nonheme iron enzyme n=1 Tax=Polaromonas sp. TaxID=1869339 RepID=UPI002D3604BD|nr:SUMF1/EgtB/PvdO family nonheme iron enzyme [Polaromonas sp.]HYW57714.1 SUMF1/EgtB/PvdO family nonheme iron enzyme [Polaromonas sp.]